MENNPFSLMFGRPPIELIERKEQVDAIIKDFKSDYPAAQINLISGVRGSGKTVFLSGICEKLRKEKDWIVIDLNPNGDLLLDMAAKLSGEKRLHALFRQAKINLSFFGLGIEVTNEPPIFDIEVALQRMLECIKKDGKRVLVAIDEVTNHRDMRIFISAYQIFIRQGLPVFLLMTGLYKNIDRVRNAESLTFLERAPRTEILPLDEGRITDSYAQVLKVDDSTAAGLARLTKGYAFAFQALGHFVYDSPNDLNGAICACRNYLYDFSYEKIWSELSEKDQKFVTCIARVHSGEVKQIKEEAQCTPNEFNPYRARLLKEGIIRVPERGCVEFALPWFGEFVIQKYS